MPIFPLVFYFLCSRSLFDLVPVALLLQFLIYVYSRRFLDYKRSLGIFRGETYQHVIGILGGTTIKVRLMF